MTRSSTLAGAVLLLMMTSSASGQFLLLPSDVRHPVAVSPFGLFNQVFDSWGLQHQQALEAFHELTDQLLENTVCSESYIVKEKIFRPADMNATVLLLGVPEPCSRHAVDYVPMSGVQVSVDEAGNLKVSANLTSGHTLVKEYELLSWADGSESTAKLQANNILRVTIPDKIVSPPTDIKVDVEHRQVRSAKKVQEPAKTDSIQRSQASSKAVQVQEPTNPMPAMDVVNNEDVVNHQKQDRSSGAPVPGKAKREPAVEETATELCPECKIETNPEREQSSQQKRNGRSNDEGAQVKQDVITQERKVHRRKEVVGSRSSLPHLDPEENYVPQPVELPEPVERREPVLFPLECESGLDEKCMKAIEKDAVAQYIENLEEEISRIKRVIQVEDDESPL